MVDYKTHGNIAILEVDNPPVNALSHHVRTGLGDGLERANKDTNIEAILICGRGKFLAGADIKEFATGVVRNKPALGELTFVIEESSKPVVSAIKGIALGGGLEIALGSHYRIAHHKAQLGFPEVNIGILPGATGTQRFPRVVGLKAALDFISSGRRFDAEEGFRIGVIDKVTTEDDILTAGLEFAATIIGKPFKDRRTSWGPVKGTENAQQLMEDAITKVKKRTPGIAAPLYAIHAVMAAANLSREDGLRREAELVGQLRSSYQSGAMQYAFFSERLATKWEVPGVVSKNVKPMSIKTGGVIGAGTMGSGITMAMLNAGIPVVLVEQNQKFLDGGVKAIRNLYEGSVKLGKMTKQQAETRIGMLKPSVNFSDLHSADVVVEAVYEDMGIKKDIFRRLDKECKPSAMLCSNTSYLNIDEMASVTSRPDKVIGTHFFVPAYYMKLLENVRGMKTSPETIATATQFATRIGKIPVLVGNCHGFVGNRMQVPMAVEAHYLVEEGCLPYQVDEVSENFGFPLGVMKINDLSGHDVGHLIRKAAAEKAGVKLNRKTRFLNGTRYCALIDILVENGRMGRKTGKGWYKYEKPHAKVPFNDDEVTSIVMKYCEDMGIERRNIPTQEILERLLYGLINVGFKILEEGIASKPEDIDAIWVLGYGWPRQCGGPMYYANMIGTDRIYERICHYWERYPSVPHWQPSLLLKKIAENKIPMKKWAHVASSTSKL